MAAVCASTGQPSATWLVERIHFLGVRGDHVYYRFDGGTFRVPFGTCEDCEEFVEIACQGNLVLGAVAYCQSSDAGMLTYREVDLASGAVTEPGFTVPIAEGFTTVVSRSDASGIYFALVGETGSELMLLPRGETDAIVLATPPSVLLNMEAASGWMLWRLADAEQVYLASDGVEAKELELPDSQEYAILVVP